MAEEPAYVVASDSETATGEDSEQLPSSVHVALGIDIGSSFCSVAVWKDSRVEVLANPRGLKRMPSHVLFRGDVPCSGVSTDISDLELYSGSAIYLLKRLLGRVDTDHIVQTCKTSPFLVETLDIGTRPFLAALVDGVWRSTSPEEVLAVLLVELRAMAEAQLGHTVRSAVLTVPAAFSRFQHTRLERACAMAGLHVLRLMPDPTAIALLYAQEQQKALQGSMESGIEKNVLIFDAGAGYCDVAIAATAGGVSQIRAVAGDSVGGDTMIQNLVKYAVSSSKPSVDEEGGMPFSRYFAQLQSAASEVMHTLSTSSSSVLECEVGSNKITKRITREEFERVNFEVFQRCEALAIQCLREAQMSADSLDDVILVGGCSHVPAIRAAISKACAGKHFYESINPLEAAVQGAAMEGAIASGLPDNSGRLDLLTIQALPHSVGLKLRDNEVLPILQKNVAIPARRDALFTTSHANQTEALILVYEGESKQASANQLLGFFKLTGIPLAQKGVPLINVCMDVDASDVLRVVVGICLPGKEKPVVPLVEVRMPNIDDGHGWYADAIQSKYGSSLQLDVLPFPKHASPQAQ